MTCQMIVLNIMPVSTAACYMCDGALYYTCTELHDKLPVQLMQHVPAKHTRLAHTLPTATMYASTMIAVCIIL